METKRLSEKSRKIEYIEYTLWYTERDKIRNGVWIIIDKSLKEEIEIRRIVDTILLIKIVLGRDN